MKRLFDGVLKFKDGEFKRLKSHFRALGKGQAPHTLFIGCSDSRVVPDLITSALPGELFVVRNIANIVPPYRETSEYVATTSAIEYALKVLAVKNVVVCGHSNCGGCQALWQESIAQRAPHTAKWLELAMPARRRIEKTAPPGLEVLDREWMTEHYNIVQQISNLYSYPGVEEAIEAGTLNVYGWWYAIETGEVFNLDPLTESFVRIE